MSEDQFTLIIRLTNGQRLEVSIDGEDGSRAENTSTTVRKVKDCIAKVDATVPADRQRLIYKGRILEDEKKLSDYDITKGATLFMVKSAAPSNQPSSPSPSNATTAASTNPTTTSVPRPSTTANNPLIPPMMANNPFGMPPMMGGQQQQPGEMPNPEQMQAMLNSPQMQGLLDNPDLLGSILEHSMQTPQMQQLMDSNPELRHLYSDPAMIQQAIQMMRNPQHMQQVMRQQDLAMSQLENMPGGFAALSNMYRNVQEPMMEAQQAGRQSDDSSGPNRNSGATDGATGAAMPNPWGSPTQNNPNRNNTNRASANAAQASPFGMPGANPWGAAAAGGGMPNPWGAAPGGGMPNPWGGPGGAAGMPGMPPGGPQNMDQIMQMLDNPLMSQMMNDLVQNNPDMIRTMLEAQNPMLLQMFQGNPEMANNFIRTMFNPTNMRSMMEMQRSMGGGALPNFGALGGMPGMFGGMPPGALGAGAGGDLDFSNLLRQFQQTELGGGAAAAAAAARAPPANPADRYRHQLQSLYGMGFDDEQANLAALQAAHGNLNRAVDHLLSAPVASPAPAPSTSGDSANNSANDASSSQDSSAKDADGTNEKSSD